MNFSEMVIFRGERGFNQAIAEAARRERTKRGEWIRRRLRVALVADGVALPDFDRLLPGSADDRTTS
jgi:hypothetical protein